MEGITTQECLIIGCGGHGRQIRNWIDAEGRYRPFGWLDADTTKLNVYCDGLQVRGTPSDFPTMAVALGVGDNRARDRYLLSRRAINIIHPLAVVPFHVRTGRGIVVGPMAMVDEADVIIGDGAIIHVGAQVHHDCRLGRSVFVGPGAVLCGHCRIGDRVMIGANATLRPGVTVGTDAVIGAGTTITHDVPAAETMIQMPARPIEYFTAPVAGSAAR